MEEKLNNRVGKESKKKCSILWASINEDSAPKLKTSSKFSMFKTRMNNLHEGGEIGIIDVACQSKRDSLKKAVLIRVFKELYMEKFDYLLTYRSSYDIVKKKLEDGKVVPLDNIYRLVINGKRNVDELANERQKAFKKMSKDECFFQWNEVPTRFSGLKDEEIFHGVEVAVDEGEDLDSTDSYLAPSPPPLSPCRGGFKEKFNSKFASINPNRHCEMGKVRVGGNLGDCANFEWAKSSPTIECSQGRGREWGEEVIVKSMSVDDLSSNVSTHGEDSKSGKVDIPFRVPLTVSYAKKLVKGINARLKSKNVPLPQRAPRISIKDRKSAVQSAQTDGGVKIASPSPPAPVPSKLGKVIDGVYVVKSSQSFASNAAAIALNDDSSCAISPGDELDSMNPTTTTITAAAVTAAAAAAATDRSDIPLEYVIPCDKEKADSIRLVKLKMVWVRRPLGLNVNSIYDAMGKVVGSSNIISSNTFARDRVEVYLAKPELARLLIQKGIILDDIWLQVFAMEDRPTRVVLDNVPPYMLNKDLANILSNYGKCMEGDIEYEKIITYNKWLKHITTSRRVAWLRVGDKPPLPENLFLKIGETSHMISVMSSHICCDFCGEAGHASNLCQKRRDDRKTRRVRPNNEQERSKTDSNDWKTVVNNKKKSSSSLRKGGLNLNGNESLAKTDLFNTFDSLHDELDVQDNLEIDRNRPSEGSPQLDDFPRLSLNKSIKTYSKNRDLEKMIDDTVKFIEDDSLSCVVQQQEPMQITLSGNSKKRQLSEGSDDDEVSRNGLQVGKASKLDCGQSEMMRSSEMDSTFRVTLRRSHSTEGEKLTANDQLVTNAAYCKGKDPDGDSIVVERTP